MIEVSLKDGSKIPRRKEVYFFFFLIRKVIFKDIPQHERCTQVIIFFCRRDKFFFQKEVYGIACF